MVTHDQLIDPTSTLYGAQAQLELDTWIEVGQPQTSKSNSLTYQEVTYMGNLTVCNQNI